MPIEVKELLIRAVMEDNQSLSGAPDRSQTLFESESAGADREAVVAECVEQVLEILKNREER